MASLLLLHCLDQQKLPCPHQETLGVQVCQIEQGGSRTPWLQGLHLVFLQILLTERKRSARFIIPQISSNIAGKHNLFLRFSFDLVYPWPELTLPTQNQEIIVVGHY